MREYQLGLGIPREQVYNQTMYILVGMLVIGLIANLLVRPIADKHFMSDEELAHEKQLAHEKAVAAVAGTGSHKERARASVAAVHPVWIALAWAAVLIPLAWGTSKTLQSAIKFFQ